LLLVYVLYPGPLPTVISSLMLRSSPTIRLIMMMGLLFGVRLMGIRPDSLLMILQ